MNEPKRRGRPRKDRGGILSAEAVLELRTPDQIEAANAEKIRLDNLERKRRQRQREAAQRDQARTAARRVPTARNFWMSQRALLSTDELTAMKEFSGRASKILLDSMLLAGEPVPPEWKARLTSSAWTRR